MPTTANKDSDQLSEKQAAGIIQADVASAPASRDGVGRTPWRRTWATRT